MQRLAFQRYNASKRPKGWLFKLSPLASFQSKYLLKFRPLTFLGIISAVKRFAATNSKIAVEVWKSHEYFSKEPKITRTVYKTLVSDQGGLLSSQERWQKDIGSITNVSVDRAGGKPMNCLMCAKRAPNYLFSISDFYSRRLATNSVTAHIKNVFKKKGLMAAKA